MWLKVGTYSGNQTAQNIDVGFTPELVIVGSDNAAGLDTVFKTAAMAGAHTVYCGAGTAAEFDAVTLITTPVAGFAVGTHAAVNQGGTTYFWLAVKGSGAPDFAYGSYGGTGAVRDITGLGFAPAVVAVKSAGTDAGNWKCERNSATETLPFLAQALLSSGDHIKDLLADGFRVGTHAKVNASGTTYYWFAFKAATAFLATGSYSATGSAGDTTVGWGPDALWVKGVGAYTAVWRTNLQGYDDCLKFRAASIGGGAVMDFGASGFHIGTDNTVNHTGDADYWVAFRENLPAQGSAAAYCAGANPALSAAAPACLVGPGSSLASQSAYAAGAYFPAQAAQGASAQGRGQAALALPAHASATALTGNATGAVLAFAPGWDPYGHGELASAAAWASGGSFRTSAQPACAKGFSAASARQDAHATGQGSAAQGLLRAHSSALDLQVLTTRAWSRGMQSVPAAKSAHLQGSGAGSAGAAAFVRGQALGDTALAELAALAGGGAAGFSSLPACLVAALPGGRLCFQAGGTQIVLDGARSYPLREPRERLQVVSRTAAGSLRVQDKGAVVCTTRLGFKGLSEADYAALLAWYEDVAVGSLNAFTFIDEAGTARLVRWQGGFDLVRTARGRYQGEVVLEVVPEAAASGGAA